MDPAMAVPPSSERPLRPRQTDDWVDELLGYEGPPDETVAALRSLRLRDDGEDVWLGALDQALSALTCWLVRLRVRHGTACALHVQLPRGANEVAAALGIFAQLARLRSTLNGARHEPPFGGSVTVIGMDSALQRRLRRVRLHNVGLADGLAVHRVRGDGQLVDPSGATVPYRAGRQRMLYLNPRVGWPPLPGERDGLVVIDRTTFRDPDLRVSALDWAAQHEGRRLLVVSNLGDRETARVLDERCAVVSHWPMIDEIVAELWRSGGPEPTRSPLTTSALLARDPGEVVYSDVHAPAFDRGLQQAIALLTDAYRVAGDLPYPLQAARRALNTLVQLVSTAEAFNRSAALDHRTRTLNSLRADVVRTRGSDLSGVWRRYGATRWERLRALITGLIDEIADDNPKFLALLSALEVSARRHPEHRLVVRVASEAAAAALVDDLLEYGERDFALGDERLQIVPWTTRLPWSECDTTEILPSLPPRSRREALWSGEANRRIVLAYPWEAEALRGILDAEADRNSEALRRSFALLDLDADAAPCATAAAPRRFDGIPDGPEPVNGLVDLDVDLTGLTADLAALERIADDPGDRDAPRPGGGAAHEPVPGYAVELEPSGQVWLVPRDTAIERVVAIGYRRSHIHDLRPGDRVIVPRGAGREDLFTRLVEEKHRDDDVQDLSIVMERWRRACRAVLADCDGHQPTVDVRLRRAGCHVCTQLDAWAEGRTIAPQHPEDIACIARLAGDTWLLRHWHRVAEVARELRGLHQQIGRVISGAMREAADEAGPNLRALAAELGTDPSDILDEFEVATVRRVEQRDEIPAHALGGVHTPDT